MYTIQRFLDECDYIFKTTVNPPDSDVSFKYKQMYDGKQYRSRVACLILYPHCKNHLQAIHFLVDSLQTYNGFVFAMILHDKDNIEKDFDYDEIEEQPDDSEPDHFYADINANGVQFKKEHVHVVIKFAEAKTNTSVAKMLGVSSNYVRMFNSLPERLNYLVHRDNANKYPYNPEFIVGPLSDIVYNNVTRAYNQSDFELFNEIIRWIDKFDKREIIQYTKFNLWCTKNGYTKAVFKSAYSHMLQKCIEQHNSVAIAILSAENGDEPDPVAKAILQANNYN